MPPIQPQDTSNKLSFTHAFGALILGGAIMGFSPVFVREAEIGAFSSAFLRVLTAIPILWIWASYEADNRWRFLPSFDRTAILAGLMFSGDLIFWHLAILNTTLANATFMVCLAPVWVMIFSKVLIDEPVTKTSIYGVITCLIGLGLLINSSIQLNPARLIGDIYGIITSIFLGLYFIAMRKGRRNDKGGSLFLSSTCITCLILLCAALIMEDQIFPQSAKGWGAVISLGVLTHAGGQGLVTIAIGALTAVFSSLVIFIEAITAAIFGWWLYGEKLSALEILGGVFILAGVWIARPEKQK